MDVRNSKSKKKIIKAYEWILLNEGVEKITVSRICEVGEVNRSTFYSNYGHLKNLESEVIRKHVADICDDRLVNYETKPTLIVSKETVHEYVEKFLEDKVLLGMVTCEQNYYFLPTIVEEQCCITMGVEPYKLSRCEVFFCNAGVVATFVDWYKNGMKTHQEELEKSIYHHLVVLLKSRRS